MFASLSFPVQVTYAQELSPFYFRRSDSVLKNIGNNRTKKAFRKRKRAGRRLKGTNIKISKKKRTESTKVILEVLPSHKRRV